ncbi:hypothetical protein GYMLUDRAFT_248246 [Collybiopsis luxurians FD-317 M1]|uniref:Uncharacterized protein n=1 Tax=Collybiopsis luxurians FD-317 M1 TaxID=944289 RepID=A0A0D0BMF7_9AGAR|nr:hypothetical protein GYMLUDRAFT_248246 [Collybiopsis luxurians FD-317 M1]
MALARNRAYQSPLSVNDQDNDVSEEEYDRQLKESVQGWVEAHIVSTSPLDFPSDSGPKKMTTDGTLSEGKSVSVVYENNEDEIQDGESRIRILNSKTASNGMLYLIDDAINVDWLLVFLPRILTGGANLVKFFHMNNFTRISGSRIVGIDKALGGTSLPKLYQYGYVSSLPLSHPLAARDSKINSQISNVPGCVPLAA